MFHNFPACASPFCARPQRTRGGYILKGKTGGARRAAPPEVFAGASDVARGLIRSRREQEQAERLERYRQLDADGSDALHPSPKLKCAGAIQTGQTGWGG
jgi:hypothetical protein